MEWMTDIQSWIALATLTALEIVLGIDNIIFISILVSRLPEHLRNKARTIGLALAMISRIVLLLSLTWVMTLTSPLFSILNEDISGRDIILIGGGIFLLIKSTFEIHNSLEGQDPSSKKMLQASFAGVLFQIMILDVIFSLDSVITAVGLAQEIGVMVIAIVIAVIAMMASASAIGNFVDSHPTIKMLALSFLMLVGVTLVAEGLNFHIPKGYIYFAMLFSVCVEMLNIKIRKKTLHPISLKKVL